jgi:hypothetical protein
MLGEPPPPASFLEIEISHLKILMISTISSLIFLGLVSMDRALKVLLLEPLVDRAILLPFRITIPFMASKDVFRDGVLASNKLQSQYTSLARP